MGSVTVKGGNAKQSSISAKVLRADGTVKRDVGMIAFYHRNPVINWAVNKWISFKRRGD
jgi:hypothetical protein